jgi:hypothetical protein
MGIYTDNDGREFSGAGVMIIEDYYAKDGTIIPSVVLVRNKHTGLFMDFGGIFESSDKTLDVTVRNELLEESVNLFNVSVDHFTEKNSVDLPVTRSNKVFYKIYMIKINGISRKYFLHNVKLIDRKYKTGMKIPVSWRETDMITHIPIKNIEFDKLAEDKRIVVQDVDSRMIMLHGRAKKALFYSHDQILELTKKEPLAKRSDLIVDTTNSFTNGTHSYQIV